MADSSTEVFHTFLRRLFLRIKSSISLLIGKLFKRRRRSCTLKNTSRDLTEESRLTSLAEKWWRKRVLLITTLNRFPISLRMCQIALVLNFHVQDTKLLELFKDDAFSVASEIKKRAEEGTIANPNSTRGRPIYTELGRGR